MRDGGEAQTVDHVVKPALADTQQVFAGDAALGRSHLEILGELALEDAIVTPGLLFRAQLDPILGSLAGARLAVLPGDGRPAGDGAFIGVAAFALEEQLLVLPAAKPAYSTGISCHELHLQNGLRAPRLCASP